MSLVPSQLETPLNSVESIPSSNARMNEDMLRKMFEKFGKILTLRLSKRKDGFTYSYITYETLQQAQSAINCMNRFEIEEKRLKVNFATQVERKSQLYEKEEQKEKETKSFADLILERMSSKKSKKKSKREAKSSKNKEKEGKIISLTHQKEEKKVKSETKFKSETEVQIKEAKSINMMQNIAKIEIKPINDEEDTEAEWSQDFDPEDLKKKPHSTFIL